MEDRVKLIVDTDIGSDIDDALCLAYLLNQPRCDILGITTCSSEPHKRAHIAADTCRRFGREIPIFVGAGMPLVGPQYQTAVHQYSLLEGETCPAFAGSAIDFMRDAILAAPGEVTLLAIGPLTNIGALFAAYPALVPLVKEVSVLGGSFFEKGRAALPVEFNIKNDAVAAAILFSCGAKVRIGGLDVSLDTRTDCDEFLACVPTDARAALLPYIRKFRERTNDMYYHDAIAAAWLFDEDICTFRRGSVQVELGAEWGRTDFIPTEDGTVLVADTIDRDAFFRQYLKIVAQ